MWNGFLQAESVDFEWVLSLEKLTQPTHNRHITRAVCCRESIQKFNPLDGERSGAIYPPAGPYAGGCASGPIIAFSGL
jgi:hypothetical protein